MKCVAKFGERTPRRVIGLALVLVASIGLSACGKANHKALPPSSTTTTISAGEQAIIDGYRQYQDAFAAASNPMNPNNPQLAQHATGEELAQLKNVFTGYLLKGQIFKGTIDIAPVVVSKTATTATIRDCYFDHGHVYDAKTNEQVDHTAETHELVLVDLVLEDGTWKVAAIHHQGSGCVSSSP